MDLPNLYRIWILPNLNYLKQILLGFGIQQSLYIFGPKYNEISRDLSNMLFIHGSVDPWHMLGITRFTCYVY